MSEFWALVDGEFGPGQGRVLVRDHVVGTLGNRSAEQALAAGEDERSVWFALCEDLQVPRERWWGDNEQQRSGSARRPGTRRRR
ncbi:MAG: hypothetical protein QG622_1783 [Actinomycetota bacterium]|nr:hypothetical protein [Actinomycetota bacterium]